jgi:hypothetical protein
VPGFSPPHPFPAGRYPEDLAKAAEMVGRPAAIAHVALT